MSKSKIPAADFAVLRRAAMVAAGFYGVRRHAETLALRPSDVSEDEKSGGLFLRIAKMKNSSFAEHVCLIPKIGNLGDACPAKALRMWLRAVKALEKTFGFEAKALFLKLDGAKVGEAMSADGQRKDITAVLGKKGLPISPRRGGAQWYTEIDRSRETAKK
jgi:hypothetical protein